MASSNTNRKEKSSSNDLYSTPIEALYAIWPYLSVDLKHKDCHTILEPCSGMNGISNYMQDFGWDLEVFTNEMFPVEGCYYHTTEDFLSEENTIGTYDLIVTNPPYVKAKEFILKGFEHAPIQWHFLRLAFLEGQSRFMDLFSLGKLSDVYVFTYRVSCKKGVEQEETANSVSYCWYRFDKNYCGQPRLHWLTKANLK